MTTPVVGPVNITANGTTVLSLAALGALNSGNQLSAFIGGTFGGGTLKLQASPDGGTNWVDIQNGSFTAPTTFNLVNRAWGLQAVLSGATNPNINIWLV